jgi:hypothetical protein
MNTEEIDKAYEEIEKLKTQLDRYTNKVKKFDINEIKRSYSRIQCLKSSLNRALDKIKNGDKAELHYLEVNEFEEEIGFHESIIKKEIDDDYIEYINNLRQTIDKKYNINEIKNEVKKEVPVYKSQYRIEIDLPLTIQNFGGKKRAFQMLKDMIENDKNHKEKCLKGLEDENISVYDKIMLKHSLSHNFIMPEWVEEYNILQEQMDQYVKLYDTF